MKFITISILLAALSANAFADDAPKNPCAQPAMPNEQSSDIVVKYFNKHMAQYKACIDKFVGEQRAIAQASQSTDVAKANQAVDAAEAAQKQYNDMIEVLNEHAKAAAEK